MVDAPGAGRSVAALVHGFATFDPRTPVAGATPISASAAEAPTQSTGMPESMAASSFPPMA